jgi:hypothetical protein
VNTILGNLFKCLVGEKPREPDLILVQSKFAFNNLVNKSIGKSHFLYFEGKIHTERVIF